MSKSLVNVIFIISYYDNDHDDDHHEHHIMNIITRQRSLLSCMHMHEGRVASSSLQRNKDHRSATTHDETNTKRRTVQAEGWRVGLRQHSGSLPP